MESAKLIERTRSAADERVVLVHLTEAGRDLRDQAPQVSRRLVQCLVEADTSDRIDWDELHLGLRDLIDSLRGSGR